MARRRREPRWLTRIVVDAIHAYDDSADLPSLAAAYWFGFARNHPYRDGNRRIAFLAAATFLGINARELDAADTDVVTTKLALAAGGLTEAELADWVRRHLRRK